MDTVFRRPIFLANWHKPWIKVVAFLLMLTFIFPCLTWTFAETSFQPETPPICINQQIVEIPEKLGKIIKSFQGNKKLIIHIQDQHCNYEVQKNIAGLIDYLAGKHGLELVGVEGAGLPVNVTKLSTFPVESVKKEVGDYFVKLGKMSGPEFYAATGRCPVRLQGVETAKHYAANRECVQRFLNAESQGYVYDLRYALDEIKQNIYDSRLIRFAAHKTAFQTGELSLLKYALYLRKQAGRQGLVLSAYPQVRCYISKQMEILPPEVDSDQLLDELDGLEIWLRADLYTTTEQQQMDELLRCLELVEKLLNISVRPEELAEYRAYPEKYQIEHFVKFISRYSEDQEYYLDQEIYTLNHYLEQAKDFYAMADQRSLDFVENLEKRMEEQGTGQAILITGGYHTEIITHELRRRGISFISVRPVLRQLDNANPYFSLLRNRRTPLEKMLSWNQKCLSLGMYFMEWIDSQVVLNEKKLPPDIRLDYKILQMTLILWWLKKQLAKGELTEAEFQDVQEYFMAHYPAFSQENGALNLNNITAFKDTILVALAGRENCAVIYPQDLGKGIPSGLISSLPIKGYKIGFYADQQKPKLEAAFSAGQAAGSEDRVLELITAHMLPWSPLTRPGVRAVLPVIKRSWEQGRIWVKQKIQQLQETTSAGLRARCTQLKQAGLALGTIDLKISDIKTWSVLLRGIWRRNSSLIFYFLPYAPIIAYSLLLANGNNPDILAVGILYSPKIKLKVQSPDRPNTTEAWRAFFNDLEAAGDNQIVEILKSVKTQYFVQISEFIRTSAHERPRDLELIKRVQQKITKFKTTSDYTDFLGSNITVPTSEKVAVENARVFSSYLDGILMVVDKIGPRKDENQVIIANLSGISAIITDSRFRGQLKLLEEAVTAFFSIISEIDVELVKAHAPYAKSMALADFLFVYWAAGKDKKIMDSLLGNIYKYKYFSKQERMAINVLIMHMMRRDIVTERRKIILSQIAENVADVVGGTKLKRDAVTAELIKLRAKLSPAAQKDTVEVQPPDGFIKRIIQAIKSDNAIAKADKKALAAVDTEIRIQCFYECMRTNKQGTLSNLDIFQLASIDLAVFLRKDMSKIQEEASGVIETMTTELNSGSYEGWSDKTSIITEQSRKIRVQFEFLEKKGEADQKDGRRQAMTLFALMEINDSAARAITAFDKIKFSLATLENKDSAGTISKGRLSMYLLRHMFSPANIIALSENPPTAAAPNLFQNVLNQLMQLEKKESAGDFCIQDIDWKKSHTIIVNLSNRAGFFKTARELQVPKAEVLVVTDKVKAGPKPSLPKVKRLSGKLSNKDINDWAENILNKIEADGSIRSDNQKQFAEIKKEISTADRQTRILLARACLKKDALQSLNHCDIFELEELGLYLRAQENDHDFGNIMSARLGRVSLVVTDLEGKPYFDGQEDIVESLESKSSRCTRNYTIINKYIEIIKNIEKAEKQLADIKGHLAGPISTKKRNDFEAEKNTLEKNLKFHLDNLVEAAKKNSTAENIPQLFITLVNRGLADKAIRDHWWQALLLFPMLEINQDMAEMHEKLSELQISLMNGKLDNIDEDTATLISESYYGIRLLKDVFSDGKIFRLAAEPQQVDLQQVFISARKNFKSEKNISVNLAASPDFFDKPRMVEGDYGGILDKILGNLVKNAKDELKRKVISAQAEEKEFSGEILIIFDQNEITVQDNGTGIPAERLRRDENDIRNLGVTTKEETGGSGIGLSVVAQRMEGLSGRLIISNHQDPAGKILGAEFKCIFQPSKLGTSYAAEDKLFAEFLAKLSEAEPYKPEYALSEKLKAAKKKFAGPKHTAKTKGEVTVPEVKKQQVIDMPLIVKEEINPKIRQAMTVAILWVEQLAYLMDLYMKEESLSGEQYQSLKKICDSLESKKKEILAEFEALCNIMQPELFKSSRGKAGDGSLVSEFPSFSERFAKIKQAVVGISVELSNLRQYPKHSRINEAGIARDGEKKIDVITKTEQAMAQVAQVFSDDIHKGQDSKRAKKKKTKRPGKDQKKYLFDGKTAPLSDGIVSSVVGAAGAIKEFDLFLAIGIGTLAAAAVLAIAMFIGGLAPAVVVTAASMAFMVIGWLALKVQQMISTESWIKGILDASKTRSRGIKNLIYKLWQSINPEIYIEVVFAGVIEPRLKTLLEKISRHKDYSEYAKEPGKMNELLIREMIAGLKAQSHEMKRLKETGNLEKARILRAEQNEFVIATLDILSKIGVFDAAKVGELKDEDILMPVRLRKYPGAWGAIIDILRTIPGMKFIDKKDMFDRPRRINSIPERAV